MELDQDNFKLDEVVVTGQGAEVQKRRLSSNVTTVSSKELERMKQGRIDQVLQNALPNVQIRCPAVRQVQLPGKVKRSIFCFL